MARRKNERTLDGQCHSSSRRAYWRPLQLDLWRHRWLLHRKMDYPRELDDDLITNGSARNR